MGFSLKVIDRVARDSTSGSDGGDRTGDGKAGQLGKVIEGASQSSMNEVLDAWGPPPRKQDAPATTNTALAEKPEDKQESGEKNLLKGHIQQNERVEDPLNTDQIGMMALSGHPVAQAGAEMLKTPAAQNKEVRDGIKRDISSMLGDWFKEQFQNVTNVISGFDKWVQANFNAGKLKEAAEGIRRAAFGLHDSTAATGSKPDGDMDNFHLKGVESPQDVAEYGTSTALGAAKTLDAAARGLTPRGFTEGTHAIAETGRQAVKNASEYYGEHGVGNLPADTTDAAKTAYDRLGQWSADRMQMEPGERADVTGAAMAVVFFITASREFIDETGLAKRLGIGSDDLANMTNDQLEAKGIKRMATQEGRDWSTAGKTTEESVSRKLDGYLLNLAHEEGGPKARWLKSALGFSSNNADELAKQLLFDESRAIARELTEFGQKYEQTINLLGANGRVIPTQVVWIKNPDNVTRLVTLIPTDR